MYIRLVFRCLLVARKENLTGFSTGLTGQSKNLDPTGNPIGFHLCSLDITTFLDFGVAAPHQNYDVTSKALNNAGFFLILTHVVSHPNAPICQVIAKSEQVGFFLIYPIAQPKLVYFKIGEKIIMLKF